MSKAPPQFNSLAALKAAVVNYLEGNSKKYPPIGKWVVTRVTDMSNLFKTLINSEEKNEKLVGINDWNVSNVRDMTEMFTDCTHFNQPLNKWKVGEVRNMSAMFAHCLSFDQDLNGWNVSKVEDMSYMFAECVDFNRSLNSWNVSQVESTEQMFKNCRNFNGDVGRWNVSNVMNMSGTFFGCSNFNKPLANWERQGSTLSNVVNMTALFAGCASFNQPIGGWNTSRVVRMFMMFNGCESFDQDISRWTVSNVTNMSGMFLGCSSFNKPLRNWERRGSTLSHVTTMEGMFQGCSAFNKPIEIWNVSRVENMTLMFNGCVNYQQNLSSWNVEGKEVGGMFRDATSMTPALYPQGYTVADNGEDEEDEEAEVLRHQVHEYTKQTGITPEKMEEASRLLNISSTECISDADYRQYVHSTLGRLIGNVPDSVLFQEKKQTLIQNLERISDVVIHDTHYEIPSYVRCLNFYILKYLSDNVRDISPDHLYDFLSGVVDDSANAYCHEDTGDVSCQKGIQERIYLAFAAYLTAILIVPDYQMLSQVHKILIDHPPTDSDLTDKMGQCIQYFGKEIDPITLRFTAANVDYITELPTSFENGKRWLRECLIKTHPTQTATVEEYLSRQPDDLIESLIGDKINSNTQTAGGRRSAKTKKRRSRKTRKSTRRVNKTKRRIRRTH